MSQRDDTHRTGFEIAVVGMAGRFPGAAGIAELWRNLRDGVESITFFTDEELRARGVSAGELASPRYVKAAPVLEGFDLFDAGFFGISPREAAVIDPQQRVFLECSWEALEDSGYDPARVDGLVGVYAGANMSSYYDNVRFNPEATAGLSPLVLFLSNEKDYVSSRVAFKLDLEGPAITVQSACSSSLVAVHLAGQGLLSGDCDLALAGGVSVRVPQKVGYSYLDDDIFSPDGHCRAFDARAQGTVFGSGAGVVVLKRLADALEDGDTVRAVIRGSAVNNDGAEKFGYTAPRVDGQAKVVSAAQLAAELEPGTISYVEAHGTGTRLGDPIEIEALTRAFRAGTDRRGFCAVGSVKTNVGHLDTAAGVAGLIKTVLALEHRQIPPSLNFERPNPEIDFAASPFYVNAALTPWEANGAPRRAGVSSFGVGGTNAHAVLEEAPEPLPTDPPRRHQLLVLSARSEAALERAAARLARHLEERPELALADVAHTLQVGRRPMTHRRALVVESREEATAALAASAPRGRLTGTARDGAGVAFLFSGQGAQYPGMAAGLYREEPRFRQEVDGAAELLRPRLGRDLRELLFPDHGKADAAAAELRETALAQPALFVVEHALARLWTSWGVEPAAMLGHSVGELVAACLAGVFGLEEALGLMAARGELMQRMPRGAMLSVDLPPEEVAAYLGEGGGLSLAAVNARDRSVVSGSEEAVATLEAELAGREVPLRRLHTSHAFHSPMMEPAAAAFRELVEQADPQTPRLPFLSNLTGTWITAEEARDPGYWSAHLLSTVRFDDGLSRLLEEPLSALLEVGPGRSLATLARRHPGRAREVTVLSSLRHPRDAAEDGRLLLETLGRLWVAGVEVDWRGYRGGERRLRVPLPTYPFERRRYWIEAGVPAIAARAPRARPPVREWFHLPSWRRRALPRDPRPGPEGRDPDRWLVLTAAGGVGDEVAKRLAAEGAEVTVAEPGEAFRSAGEGRYTVAPGDPADYGALLRALDGRLPTRILHLLNLSPGGSPGGNGAVAAGPEVEERGFWSLLALARSLGETGLAALLELTVVADGLFEVTGGEELTPGKATLLGPARVIPLEYPGLSCRVIDPGPVAAGSPAAADLAARLLAELRSGAPDPVVALRGDHRWVQGFEATALEASGLEEARLRQGGVYLITGGLGGLGLAFAQALAGELQARLALVGRSPMPERDAWDEHLRTCSGDDGTGRRIRAVQALEEAGAEVLVATADVTDRQALAAVVAAAEERFGALHGVIHAAGVPGGGVIQLKERPAAEAVLAPKVAGTLALAAALEGRELDFLILCSSVLGVTGEVGQVDYCAANAFLDAFAHLHRREGTFTVSVDWDAWSGTGMAAEAAQASPDGARGRRLAIEPTEGVEALARVLTSCPLPQVVVSPLGPDPAVRRAGLALRDVGDGVEAGEQEALPRPELETAYAAPASEPERTLAEIWQSLLGIERVGIHDNFFELGGDSVLGLLLAVRAREAGLSLSQSRLFESPTIAELAAALGGGEDDGGEAATGEGGAPGAEPAEAADDAPLVDLSPEEMDQLREELDVG